MEISEEQLPLLEDDELTTNNDEKSIISNIVEKPYNGYKYKTAEEALEAKRASKRKYNEKMRHKDDNIANTLKQINIPYSITPNNTYGTKVESAYPEIFLPLAKILENISILMENVHKLSQNQTDKKE